MEYTAYVLLMNALAEEGILCVLVEMPFNLAVLNTDAAAGIPEHFPNIKEWYMGGTRWAAVWPQAMSQWSQSNMKVWLFWYGLQTGDGNPLITQMEQMERTVQLLTDFLSNTLTKPQAVSLRLFLWIFSIKLQQIKGEIKEVILDLQVLNRKKYKTLGKITS